MSTLRVLAQAAGAAASHVAKNSSKFDLEDPRNPKSKDYMHKMYDWGWADPFYHKDDVHKECAVLDNFAIIMQIILGVASFASLLLKRKWEVPKRSWKIFLLDISK